MVDEPGSGPPDNAAEARRAVAERALAEAASSNREVLDSIVPELYGEMRAVAHHQLRSERTGHTLSTTALVHEAYLKLARLDRLAWRNRAQFMAEAARAMRRILVDHALRRGAKKRGGGRRRVELVEELVMTKDEAGQLLALHGALESLESLRSRAARVVECRFFAGMSIQETATALEIAPATVKRDWDFARAWLNRELSGEAGAG